MPTKHKDRAKKARRMLLKAFKEDLYSYNEIDYTRVIKRNEPFFPKQIVEIVIEIRLRNKIKKVK